MGVLSNVMRTNKSNPIQLKFFQGQHQSHPHINIAIRRMWSYFWSGAHLLQNIISRGLRSHWVSPSEWWWWSSWSWWSKWSTGLSGPHLLFGVFIIIRKVSFILFHLYISVRFQICFFNKFTPLKNHVRISPTQQDVLNLIASDFPQNHQSFKLRSPMGFVFQKLKYVIFGEKPKGDWCEAGKAEKLCWNFQQTYDASPSLTQTTCG